ncbi:MAG: hypothetical protein GW949_03235 [Spirochaetales bacterium]|nr:hypothetical protein [Spirochaetales bacterium]
MEIHSYFSTNYLQNTYIINKKDRQETIILDPFEIEAPLFELLENLELEVTSVLLTHVDKQKWSSVQSLKRIYGTIEVYGGIDDDRKHDLVSVKELDFFETCGISVQPIFIPGHHSDSLMFRMDQFLFSGSLIGAGLIDKADESFGRALLIQCLQETFEELPKQTILFPSSGPPSSVGAELKTNYSFRHQERLTARISAKLFSEEISR